MRKIKQISVTELFGIFNHIIPLNLDEKVTIIHSPNGFGKTAILKLLNDLFSQKNRALRTTPFNEFRVDFEDGSYFRVTSNFENASEDSPKNKAKKDFTRKITFYFREHDNGERNFSLKTLSTRTFRDTFPYSVIEHVIPEADRIGVNSWRMTSTGEILSVEEILERYSDQLLPYIGPSVVQDKEPDWLREIRGSIPIRFIETQRLLNPRRINRPNEPEKLSSMTSTVTMYSEELAEIIKTKLAESTALSQSLDRTFPRRMLSTTTKLSNITETELRYKLAELETKRANLMAAGLVDKDDNDAVQVTDKIDTNTKAVLSVYIEDVEKKLGIFDEVANKIDLLKRIINKRFLYKKMTISRRDGFVFIAPNGTRLALENLSSGEQHELVLFYELLFKASPGSLILIDEPEISLHVVWQEQFLEDVQEITQLANVDVLIATHSPDIIDGRRELVVQLEGPNNGRL